MRIISRSTLIEYYSRNPDARTALEEWFQKTRRADWSCFADVKRTRLVAVVKFTIRTVYIRFVGTHPEYDKIDVKNI